MHSLTARAGDVAGNESAASQTLEIVIDTVAPVTPNFGLEPDDDTGDPGNDFTANQIVDLIGATEAGAQVVLVDPSMTTTSDAGGIFRFDDVMLDNGANDFTVRATDAAGNMSQATRTIFRGTGPIIVSPLPDIDNLQEDSDARQISLLNRYRADSALTFTVINSNRNLISETLSGNNLTLNFLENRSGVSDITIRATTPMNGQFIDDVFRVTVTPVNDDPVLARTLPDLGNQASTGANDVINIGGLFADADNVGTLVRFDTSLGPIGIELFDDTTPLSVANVLAYVNDTTASGGDYDGTFFHRSNPGFVIQGGSFEVGGSGFPNAVQIPTDPDVDNEFRISNTRGTLSLAKTAAGEDSATSGFFFSVADNAANLDNQNGGFTVFARVLPGTMGVVDAIEDATIVDLQPSVPNEPFDPFGQVPVQDGYDQADANAQVPLSSSVVMELTNAVIDPTLSGARGSDRNLTFTVTNPNPAAVNVSLVETTDPMTGVTATELVLDYNPTLTQATLVTILVRATDGSQEFEVDEFTVNVVPPTGPLVLAGSDSTANPAIAVADIAAFNPRALSPEMEAVVRQAAALWVGAGLDPAAASRLADAQVQVADLPGTYLGLAIGNQVWLDSDAAGLGWFVDSTPADNLEFVADVAGQLRAVDGLAAGRVDLLTVAAHEFGHVLGLGHLDAHEHHGELLSESLGGGMRRLPTASAVDMVFAGL
jgi:cyclophilin family peptidyl-prolyl cis-trans isomerase